MDIDIHYQDKAHSIWVYRIPARYYSYNTFFLFFLFFFIDENILNTTETSANSIGRCFSSGSRISYLHWNSPCDADSSQWGACRVQGLASLYLLIIVGDSHPNSLQLLSSTSCVLPNVYPCQVIGPVPQGTVIPCMHPHSEQHILPPTHRFPPSTSSCHTHAHSLAARVTCVEGEEGGRRKDCMCLEEELARAREETGARGMGACVGISPELSHSAC